MNLFNPFVLLAIGFLLLFLEFFLPGGVIGISAILFILGSLVAFVLEGHSPLLSLLYFVFVTASIAFFIRWILYAIKKTGPKNTIMLDSNQEGFVASHFDKSLIGKEGIALTDLKPAGKILVEGKEVQALSELGYISRSLKIQVVGGKGNHLVVKRID